MSHRKRVTAALNHEETDKVPIDLEGAFSTGIMAIEYNRVESLSED